MLSCFLFGAKKCAMFVQAFIDPFHSGWWPKLVSFGCRLRPDVLEAVAISRIRCLVSASPLRLKAFWKPQRHRHHAGTMAYQWENVSWRSQCHKFGLWCISRFLGLFYIPTHLYQ